MDLVARLRDTYQTLRREMMTRYRRHVSFGDLVADRWETAQFLGFGEGSSCYDSVLVMGNVRVGCHTWIGPNVILDGRGDLEIGDYVSVSAGVHIYTHNTVAWSTSSGRLPEQRAPTRIGSGVYLGPQSVIAMGVTIGDGAVIGAMSYVDRDIPPGMRAWGQPARIIDDNTAR